MTRLTLRESKAIADLAQFLYDFLPGSGSPKWKGHVSFKTVASKVGLEDFWQTGSKLPMITSLLQKTLEFRRHLFEHLTLEIVRAGIIYKEKSGHPLRPEHIDTLNGMIFEIGFKFPDLWDQDFRNSLCINCSQRAQEIVDRAIKEGQIRESSQSKIAQQILELKDRYFGLHNESNRQKAGFAFEKILNCLFALHGLAPREPFKIVGEQIDGSFELDHETYILEAKWHKEPVSLADLLIFRGKIEGKSAYTRGVFISISGISDEARGAIVTGKQPTFFIADGYDLNMILSEHIGLIDFLRQRRRILAEEGLVKLQYQELWDGSRKRY